MQHKPELSNLPGEAFLRNTDKLYSPPFSIEYSVRAAHHARQNAWEERRSRHPLHTSAPRPSQFQIRDSNRMIIARFSRWKIAYAAYEALCARYNIPPLTDLWMWRRFKVSVHVNTRAHLDRMRAMRHRRTELYRVEREHREAHHAEWRRSIERMAFLAEQARAGIKPADVSDTTLGELDMTLRHGATSADDKA